MADWDDMLGDLDRPRPLGEELRGRLEQQLTGGGVAVLLATAEEPRALGPELRARLLSDLVRPSPAWRRPGAFAAAAAAVAGVAAAVALLVPGGTTAPRTTAQAPVVPGPVATDVVAPGAAATGDGGSVVRGPTAVPRARASASAAPSSVGQDTQGSAARPQPAAAPGPAAAAPTVSGLAPASGPFTGGTVVTVTGTGFTPGATVHFGGTPSGTVEVVSETTLRATTPSHLPGEVDVVVTTSTGSSPIGTPSHFRYTA